MFIFFQADGGVQIAEAQEIAGELDSMNSNDVVILHGSDLNTSEGGGIQQFGSQNHVASLRQFVTNGFALELGITEDENPEISQSIQNVVSFIRFLAPPPRGEINEDVLLGEQVFA